MDTKPIKDIVRLMQEYQLIEVEIDTPDLKLKLRKAAPATPAVAALAIPQATFVPVPAPAAGAAPATAAPAPRDEFADCKQVISPIPGTVYLKPNPDAADFVQVGTPVDESKVVCLVEAMKVFNEIKPDAGIRGTIKKVLVTDGQAVEYGTVHFLVG
jgi:acetyl-CoA carboxylase biotin carboxyl carrier protein